MAQIESMQYSMPDPDMKMLFEIVEIEPNERR